MMKRLSAILSILMVFAVAGVLAQEKAANPETESSVPELDAFHEIIYPIWHTAYPDKDIAALKSYVPQINELAAKIYAAKLPGILREKDAKWKAGLAEFKKSVDAYNAAAAGSDNEALLKAAEALHMRYEMLVRTIRPVLPQVDAFHKVLYVVYHSYLPEKKWDEVRKAAPELDAKAEAVTKATLSKRLEPKTADFTAAAAGLKAATAELVALGAGADGLALVKAVDKIHAKYQALEKIFD
ncbi:MAG TPA: hypothetical protein VLJ16_05880 [Acidobacteriota bacterium]|nr:hypothetical protein [Acidobacteriota bacterium]